MDVFNHKLLRKSDLWGRRRDPEKRRTGPRPRGDPRSDMAHRSFVFFKKRKRYLQAKVDDFAPGAFIEREPHPLGNSVSMVQVPAAISVHVVLIGDEDDDLKGEARVRAAIWV